MPTNGVSRDESPGRSSAGLPSLAVSPQGDGSSVKCVSLGNSSQEVSVGLLKARNHPVAGSSGRTQMQRNPVESGGPEFLRIKEELTDNLADPAPYAAGDTAVAEEPAELGRATHQGSADNNMKTEETSGSFLYRKREIFEGRTTARLPPECLRLPEGYAFGPSNSQVTTDALGIAQGTTRKRRAVKDADRTFRRTGSSPQPKPAASSSSVKPSSSPGMRSAASPLDVVNRPLHVASDVDGFKWVGYRVKVVLRADNPKKPATWTWVDGVAKFWYPKFRRLFIHLLEDDQETQPTALEAEGSENAASGAARTRFAPVWHSAGLRCSTVANERGWFSVVHDHIRVTSPKPVWSPPLAFDAASGLHCPPTADSNPTLSEDVKPPEVEPDCKVCGIPINDQGPNSASSDICVPSVRDNCWKTQQQRVFLCSDCGGRYHVGCLSAEQQLYYAGASAAALCAQAKQHRRYIRQRARADRSAEDSANRASTTDDSTSRGPSNVSSHRRSRSVQVKTVSNSEDRRKRKAEAYVEKMKRPKHASSTLGNGPTVKRDSLMTDDNGTLRHRDSAVRLKARDDPNSPYSSHHHPRCGVSSNTKPCSNLFVASESSEATDQDSLTSSSASSDDETLHRGENESGRSCARAFSGRLSQPSVSGHFKTSSLQSAKQHLPAAHLDRNGFAVSPSSIPLPVSAAASDPVMRPRDDATGHHRSAGECCTDEYAAESASSQTSVSPSTERLSSSLSSRFNQLRHHASTTTSLDEVDAVFNAASACGLKEEAGLQPAGSEPEAVSPRVKCERSNVAEPVSGELPPCAEARWLCPSCVRCHYCYEYIQDASRLVALSTERAVWACTDAAGGRIALTPSVVCHSCGLIAHGVCCFPEVPQLHPNARWRCDRCSECRSCGYKDTQWTDYTAWDATFLHCARCFRSLELGLYCGECRKPWDVMAEQEGSQTWMCCDSCGLWIHAKCDPVEAQAQADALAALPTTPTEYDTAESASSTKEAFRPRTASPRGGPGPGMNRTVYRCPVCRTPDRNARFLRVLDRVIVMDKKREFSYPVPKTFVSYWRVVKAPMNFMEMKAKVYHGLYDNNVENFLLDFYLVLHNAKLAHMPNTRIHRNARSLEKKGGALAASVLERPKPTKADILAIHAKVARLASCAPEHPPFITDIQHCYSLEAVATVLDSSLQSLWFTSMRPVVSSPPTVDAADADASRQPLKGPADGPRSKQSMPRKLDVHPVSLAAGKPSGPLSPFASHRFLNSRQRDVLRTAHRVRYDCGQRWCTVTPWWSVDPPSGPTSGVAEAFGGPSPLESLSAAQVPYTTKSVEHRGFFNAFCVSASSYHAAVRRVRRSLTQRTLEAAADRLPAFLLSDLVGHLERRGQVVCAVCCSPCSTIPYSLLASLSENADRGAVVDCPLTLCSRCGICVGCRRPGPRPPARCEHLHTDERSGVNARPGESASRATALTDFCHDAGASSAGIDDTLSASPHDRDSAAGTISTPKRSVPFAVLHQCWRCQKPFHLYCLRYAGKLVATNPSDVDDDLVARHLPDARDLTATVSSSASHSDDPRLPSKTTSAEAADQAASKQTSRASVTALPTAGPGTQPHCRRGSNATSREADLGPAVVFGVAVVGSDMVTAPSGANPAAVVVRTDDSSDLARCRRPPQLPSCDIIRMADAERRTTPAVAEATGAFGSFSGPPREASLNGTVQADVAGLNVSQPTASQASHVNAGREHGGPRSEELPVRQQDQHSITSQVVHPAHPDNAFSEVNVLPCPLLERAGGLPPRSTGIVASTDGRGPAALPAPGSPRAVEHQETSHPSGGAQDLVESNAQHTNLQAAGIPLTAGLHSPLSCGPKTAVPDNPVERSRCSVATDGCNAASPCGNAVVSPAIRAGQRHPPLAGGACFRSATMTLVLDPISVLVYLSHGRRHGLRRRHSRSAPREQGVLAPEDASAQASSQAVARELLPDTGNASSPPIVDVLLAGYLSGGAKKHHHRREWYLRSRHRGSVCPVMKQQLGSYTAGTSDGGTAAPLSRLFDPGESSRTRAGPPDGKGRDASGEPHRSQAGTSRAPFQDGFSASTDRVVGNDRSSLNPEKCVQPDAGRQDWLQASHSLAIDAYNWPAFCRGCADSVSTATLSSHSSLHRLVYTLAQDALRGRADHQAAPSGRRGDSRSKGAARKLLVADSVPFERVNCRAEVTCAQAPPADPRSAGITSAASVATTGHSPHDVVETVVPCAEQVEGIVTEHRSPYLICRCCTKAVRAWDFFDLRDLSASMAHIPFVCTACRSGDPVPGSDAQPVDSALGSSPVRELGASHVPPSADTALLSALLETLVLLLSDVRTRLRYTEDVRALMTNLAERCWPQKTVFGGGQLPQAIRKFINSPAFVPYRYGVADDPGGPSTLDSTETSSIPVLQKWFMEHPLRPATCDYAFVDTTAALLRQRRLPFAAADSPARLLSSPLVSPASNNSVKGLSSGAQDTLPFLWKPQFAHYQRALEKYAAKMAGSSPRERESAVLEASLLLGLFHRFFVWHCRETKTKQWMDVLDASAVKSHDAFFRMPEEVAQLFNRMERFAERQTDAALSAIGSAPVRLLRQLLDTLVSVELSESMASPSATEPQAPEPCRLCGSTSSFQSILLGPLLAVHIDEVPDTEGRVSSYHHHVFVHRECLLWSSVLSARYPTTEPQGISSQRSLWPSALATLYPLLLPPAPVSLHHWAVRFLVETRRCEKRCNECRQTGATVLCVSCKSASFHLPCLLRATQRKGSTVLLDFLSRSVKSCPLCPENPASDPEHSFRWTAPSPHLLFPSLMLLRHLQQPVVINDTDVHFPPLPVVPSATSPQPVQCPGGTAPQASAPQGEGRLFSGSSSWLHRYKDIAALLEESSSGSKLLQPLFSTTVPPAVRRAVQSGRASHFPVNKLPSTLDPSIFQLLSPGTSLGEPITATENIEDSEQNLLGGFCSLRRYWDADKLMGLGASDHGDDAVDPVSDCSPGVRGTLSVYRCTISRNRGAHGAPVFSIFKRVADEKPLGKGGAAADGWPDAHDLDDHRQYRLVSTGETVSACVEQFYAHLLPGIQSFLVKSGAPEYIQQAFPQRLLSAVEFFGLDHPFVTWTRRLEQPLLEVYAAFNGLPAPACLSERPPPTSPSLKINIARLRRSHRSRLWLAFDPPRRRPHRELGEAQENLAVFSGNDIPPPHQWHTVAVQRGVCAFTTHSCVDFPVKLNTRRTNLLCDAKLGSSALLANDPVVHTLSQPSSAPTTCDAAADEEAYRCKSSRRTELRTTQLTSSRSGRFGAPRQKFDQMPQAMQYRYLTIMEQESRVQARLSPIHGMGLFAVTTIPKGEPVVEYVGHVIRNIIADKRENFYELSGSKDASCYMFRLNPDFVVDATTAGNVARFINHSCEPNCICRVISAENGSHHIVIFAARDIKPGDEVTYDYKFNVEEESLRIVCRCGALSCLGRMN